MRPPHVRDGTLRVLAALGPDLPSTTWAAILDEDVLEVRAARRWLERADWMRGRRAVSEVLEEVTRG